MAPKPSEIPGIFEGKKKENTWGKKIQGKSDFKWPKPLRMALKMAQKVLKAALKHRKSTKIPRFSVKYLWKEILKNPRKNIFKKKSSRKS